jgi:hypothetical protein
MYGYAILSLIIVEWPNRHVLDQQSDLYNVLGSLSLFLDKEPAFAAQSLHVSRMSPAHINETLVKAIISLAHFIQSFYHKINPSKFT